MFKKSLLLFSSIFVFGLQAKWIEFPSTFQKVSTFGNHIWASNTTRKTEQKNGLTYSFFSTNLFKFNDSKNTWQKIVTFSNPTRISHITALYDGTVLVAGNCKLSKETQNQYTKIEQEKTLIQKQAFDRFIAEGKIPKKYIAIRDQFERKDPQYGWHKFLRSKEFENATISGKYYLSSPKTIPAYVILKSTRKAYFQEKHDGIHPINVITIRKISPDGNIKKYVVKILGTVNQMISTPDGALFILAATSKTQQSLATYEAAKKNIDKQAIKELAKKHREFVFYKNNLKKITGEGKTDKKTYDLMESAIKEYNPFVDIEKQKKLKLIIQEAKKTGKESDKIVLSGLFLVHMAAYSWYRYKKNELKKRFIKYVRPLYRFYNGSFQQIGDLKPISESSFGENYTYIAAATKNELWLLRRKKVNDNERNFVEKWNGSSFEQVGGDIIAKGTGSIAVGLDNSVYVTCKKGERFFGYINYVYVLQLKNDTWQTLPIEFDKKAENIESIHAITKNNVWFFVEEEGFKNSTYHWNGIHLKQIIKNIENRGMFGSQQDIFIRTTNSKLYKWTDGAHKKPKKKFKHLTHDAIKE